MRWLDRLRGGGEVPDWAPFTQVSDHKRFLDAVHRDLRDRGLSFEEIGGGGLRLANGNVLGLANLAQAWNLTPDADRAKVMRDHFDRLFRHWDEAAEDKPKPSFDEVRGQLRMRLVPDDFAASAREVTFVHRPFAPGIVAAVAIDWPDRVEFVDPERLVDWGQTPEQVFDLALDNVLANEAVTVERTGDPKAPASFLLGDSYYVSAHAVRLDRFIVPATPHGAVFSVPNRHAVIVQPIRDVSILGSIRVMLVATADMYREGPGSVSPALYWWRDGAISVLPGKAANGVIEFQPPDAFAELLNSLPEPTAEPEAPA
jgi:hypothetical protein